MRAYHAGAFCQAEQKIDALAIATKTEQTFTKNKESSWILLDQATVHFAMDKTKEALSDYAQALESIDYYDKSLPTEQCAQILLQDETAAYQADDFEQVLARVYFALVLLHEGDESNAFAILRQAEEFQQERRQFYAKVPFTQHFRLADNGLSKYLLALLLERKGDSSNAKLLYRQASQLFSCNNDMTPPLASNGERAILLVLCHNGNAPYKISATSPASVASACALEILLASQRIDPAWSTLTGIPVPALCIWPGSAPLPTEVRIEGIKKPLLPLFNVAQAASDQLEQKMPVIVARGVARLLMRRSTVGYFNRQDPCLGMLADLTMMIVNSQTRADTRSWTTLPATIDGARFDLDPGCRNVTLQVFDGCAHETGTFTLDLRPHDLCIIHIFNIHPGVRTILIPSRFQGDSL